MKTNQLNNIKPSVKLVYFNRRETELSCDKLDDNEVFTLKGQFESSPIKKTEVKK